LATIDEIILNNPDAVGYFVQLEGNENPSLRYLMNKYDENKATIQQVDTFNLIEVLRTTGGYEVYVPPLEDPLSPYKDLINDAISYFKSIQVEFAAENITLGISQSGKTKDVSDYLKNVLRYGQTGSLYEVISEIDLLIQSDPPEDLEPFITVDRLNVFKAKVSEFFNSN